MEWLLGKTYKVSCPDGPRVVYRNIDNIFPLYLKNVKIAAAAAAKATREISGDIKAQYEDKVTELTYKIDEFNASTQSHLRSAYLVYQASPCTKLDYFEQAVEVITSREDSLRRADTAVKMVVAAAVALSKGGVDPELTLSRAGESLTLAIDSLQERPTAPALVQNMSRVEANGAAWRQE